MAQKREIIKNSSLFKNFSDDIIDRFLNAAETRTYSAGDIIFVELSEGDEIFMILEGEVTAEVALSNADQNLEVLTVSAGETFGEGCFFVEKLPRYATATSKTKSAALVWKSRVWREIGEDNFEVGYRLAVGVAKVLLDRVRHWNIRILDNISWGLD